MLINGGDPLFLGHDGSRSGIVADKVEIDIDLLLAVSRPASGRRMNLNTVYELIKHIVCQLRNGLILLHQSDETVDICFLRRIGNLCGFQFSHPAFQL